MNQHTQVHQTTPVTHQMADWIVSFDGNVPQARIWARHVLLDWLAVTIAGAREKISRVLADVYSDTGKCNLIGQPGLRRAEDAALINGTSGHVLDYDDGCVALNGHATAPVAPAVLALGQELGSSGRDIITAMIIGQEIEIHLGQAMSPYHYERGFHATATMGTIGAAAAAARLFGLTADQTAHALGFASTQAAGLKSMFGSDAKSFQVGKAAMNGVIAARLAHAGLISNPEGIECAQGFGTVLSDSFEPKPFVAGSMERWGIAQNAFKYHGACFMTHSAIEAAGMIRRDAKIGLEDIQAVSVDVIKTALTVCDIQEPKTGLESKFAIRHLVCAALRGDDTSGIDRYTDAFATDPQLVTARDRVTLNTPPENAALRIAARVHVTTSDGTQHSQHFDAAELPADTDQQWHRLFAKARSLLGDEAAEELVDALDGLEDADAIDSLLGITIKS